MEQPRQGPRLPRIARVRKRVPVRFSVSLTGPGAIGFTVNISARGMCISAPTVHPAGTRLNLELKLSDEETCQLIGLVAWSMRGIVQLTVPGTMGIRIESSDERFFRFLASVSPPTEKSRSSARPSDKLPVTPLGRPRPARSEPPAPRRSGTSAPSPPARARTVPPPLSTPKPRSKEEETGAPRVDTRNPTMLSPGISPGLAAGRTAGGTAGAGFAPVAQASPPLQPPAPVPLPVGMSSAPDWFAAPAEVERTVPPAVLKERARRYPVRLAVRYGTGRPLAYGGETQNVSRSGLAISCETPFAPGETVLFVIEEADGALCHGTGSVAWTRLGQGGAGATVMGIRLVRVEERYRGLVESVATAPA